MPTSTIIDVSPRQSTWSQSAALFADLALAILCVLAVPLVLTAMSLPAVWLVNAAAGLLGP